jgi:hypothetical protein
MGRFIRRRNVERYWRLLDRVSNESDRQRILELLVQERQKQKDAGDLHLSRNGFRAVVKIATNGVRFRGDCVAKVGQ